MKFKKIILLLILLCLTGCFKRDNLEGINIITTIYPLEYISNQLYGENSIVNSIYPDGTNIKEYELNDKQLTDYSKKEMFIYTGLSQDRDIALTLLNKNKKLLIIDASFGMEIQYGIEELWLNPSNLLMMSQNIRDGLNEYTTSNYLEQEINEKYNNLKVTLSELDAKFKNVQEKAEKTTLVVSSNVLKYLEKYGFNVISLEDENIIDKTINDVTNMIKRKEVSYIIMLENIEPNNTIKNIISNTKVSTLTYKSLSNLTDEERDNHSNYLTLMEENIETLKKASNSK